VTAKSLLEYLPAGLIPFIDAAARGDCKLVEHKSIKGAGHSGETALGVLSDALPAICEAILRARQEGALRSDQLGIAEQAERLVRGFAKTGLVALIDEATGYQEVRDRDALERILQRYVVPEIQPHLKRFTDDYYVQIARLHNWDTANILKEEKPGVVGRYTNDFIYARLAPGILDALHGLVPRDEKGKLEHKLHQHLTPEEGIIELGKHIASIVTLMKLASTWRGFVMLANKAHPRYRSTMLLPLDDDLAA
jgi:hypothetical protein